MNDYLRESYLDGVRFRIWLLLMVGMIAFMSGFVLGGIVTEENQIPCPIGQELYVNYETSAKQCFVDPHTHPSQKIPESLGVAP